MANIHPSIIPHSTIPVRLYLSIRRFRVQIFLRSHAEFWWIGCESKFKGRYCTLNPLSHKRSITQLGWRRDCIRESSSFHSAWAMCGRRTLLLRDKISRVKFDECVNKPKRQKIVNRTFCNYSWNEQNALFWIAWINTYFRKACFRCCTS